MKTSLIRHWYVTWFCDLDLCPFNLDQLVIHGGSRDQLATKFEDPTPIRSWVMSYNFSRWLSMKMRTRPLRMRRITWPVSRGSQQLHFWNARRRFAYSLCSFGGSTMKIIKVIFERNARPCAKKHMSFCARVHVTNLATKFEDPTPICRRATCIGYLHLGDVTCNMPDDMRISLFVCVTLAVSQSYRLIAALSVQSTRP